MDKQGSTMKEIEDQNAWRKYLEAGNFNLARKCAADNKTHLDFVLRKQCEKLMEDKKYVAAAEIYSMTEAPLEQVALKLQQVESRLALKTYLQKKLDKLESNERTRKTILVFWLLEILLTELDEAKCGSDKSDSSNACEEVLNILQKQKNVDLFYKFSSQMLDIVPEQLIDAWISMGPSLNPKSMLMTSFKCDKNADTAVHLIRYYEHCISRLNCNDTAIHNYLISLYARYAASKIMIYLQNEGKDLRNIRYEPKFALKICLEAKLCETSVFIYCIMNMFEDAMKLALTVVGHDLAKFVAKWPEEQETQRKLWLMFARDVIEKDNDVRNCVALLKSSDGLIKIQDLLPFFPDFATIDNFRDSLCDCLAEHSGTIKNLQLEMKEASDIAQQIKNDIHEANQRFVALKSREKCSSCNRLLSDQIFAFLCDHKFHRRCLVTELECLVDDETQQHIEDIESRIRRLEEKGDDAISTYSGNSLLKENESKIDELLQELDTILTSECPYCGFLSIESINKPFFMPSEYAEELKKWH
uniref:Vacuolar protein sorting-associated protein 18 homolog n=1 Tax=Romanomermis culicivorax TaxID=13658 RepID=A0A915J6G2_ROMCU